MPNIRPVVSVIIVVKNDRGIAATLERLAEIGQDTSHEVIVVDASKPAELAGTAPAVLAAAGSRLFRAALPASSFYDTCSYTRSA